MIVVSVVVMMVVAVTMVMAVIVMTVIVIVPVVMGVPVPAVTSRLRLERQGRRVDRETELPAHPVEHVVVRVEHEVRKNLQRDVAVSEVIRGASQKMRITRTGSRDLLGRRLHAQSTRAVLGREAIALSEHATAGEHQPDGLTAREGEPEPRSAALFVAELDRERRLGGLVSRDHAGEDLHASSEQKIALREREDLRRLAGEELSVRTHLVSL